MNKKQTVIIRNTSVSGAAILGGFLVKTLVAKIRNKMKGGANERIHEASWGEALKWTLVASVASGLIRLVIKRYTQEGLARWSVATPK